MWTEMVAPYHLPGDGCSGSTSGSGRVVGHRRPLIPKFTARRQGGGTAPVDERAVFTAIVDSASVRAKRGLAQRPQSGRSGQDRLPDPCLVGCGWHPVGHRRDRRERPRQPDAAADGGSDSGDSVPARAAPAAARAVARRQGLRVGRSPALAAVPVHHPAPRPPRYRGRHPIRSASMEDRTHPGLACRIPTPDHPLRTPRTPLRGISRSCCRAHLL